MREYIGLFRGKRIDNGEWVEGYLENCYPQGQWVEIVWFDNSEEWIIRRRCAEVDPDTIGECCGGLKDKNGKLIFEGDIVRHYDGNPDSEIEEKGAVFWDEIFCGWRRTSNGAFHHGAVDTYRMSPSCVYEIIGNIYDNGELLKGDNNG